jgi:hypothetical protein
MRHRRRDDVYKPSLPPVRPGIERPTSVVASNVEAPVATSSAAPWEELEDARSTLTARYPSSGDVCSGVCAWASGMASAAYEHALSPVLRTGAMARVALADVAQPLTGGAS